MKTLHLLRHAKSGWGDHNLSDRERPLNDRGQRDAPRMGAALADIMEPMAVSVSPARRAQMTLEGVCAGWPVLAGENHSTEEALYTFSRHELTDWLSAQGEAPPALFLLCHNPALTELVNTLTRRSALDNLPTAGYVQLSLDIDHWDQLLHCEAVLDHYLFPKQLT